MTKEEIRNAIAETPAMTSGIAAWLAGLRLRVKALLCGSAVETGMAWQCPCCGELLLADRGESAAEITALGARHLRHFHPESDEVA